MKKLLLTLLLFLGVLSLSAQGTADFGTLTQNTSYSTYTTTAGWKAANSIVVCGGSSDNNPVFKFIGNSDATKGVCLNGKTSSKGTLTSPELVGGIGQLSFKYGLPYADKNGVSVKIEIKQDGEVVKSQTLTNKSAAQKTAYEFTSENFDVAGKFTIVITNLCPSNKTTNADRTAIWDLSWTGFTAGNEPKVAMPAIEMVETDNGFEVTMACATEGAKIYYNMSEESMDAVADPTAESTEYTAPVAVSKTTYFKAIGLNAEGDSYVASFTANPPTVFNSFAPIVAGEVANSTKVIFKGDIQNLYQYKFDSGDNFKYMYLKLGDSYILCYNSSAPEMSNGDTFKRLEATVNKSYNLFQLTGVNITDATTITAGTPVEPEVMAVSDITADKLYYYVKLENVTIGSLSGKDAKITDAAGNSVNLYNQFALDLEEVNNATVIGFVAVHSNNVQVQPISIEGEEVVDAPVFTPASGTTVEKGSVITIAPAVGAVEGTQVYYRVAGADEFSLYTESGVEVPTEGTEFTVEAYAKHGEVVSETVSATYTITAKQLRNLRWMLGEEEADEVLYVYGESDNVLPTLEGATDGEAEYTSSDTEVAVYDNDTKTLEVVGLGETTITVSIAENDEYEAGEASYILRVIEKNNNVVCLVEFGNQTWEGYTADNKTATWVSEDGVEFETELSLTGSTYAKIYTNDLRIYASAGNQITVNAPLNLCFKSLSFVVDMNTSNNEGNTIPTIDGEDTTKATVAASAAARAAAKYETYTYTFDDEAQPTKFVLGTSTAKKNMPVKSVTMTIAPIKNSVTNLEAADENAPVEYYNLQGIRVVNPENGLYIRRQGNKVSKVVL